MAKAFKVPVSNKKGYDLLEDPFHTRGTSFTESERKKLGIEGLLPPTPEKAISQMKRELHNLNAHGKSLEKYSYLMHLLDRNQWLYYKLTTLYVREVLPLIYTPTVGAVCEKYSHLFNKSLGLYVTIKDKDNIGDILKRWPIKDVKVIVFTDGEKVLGLGDLGVNSMPLVAGKAQLYAACAKIPYWQCLPVCLDVGTENEALLDDPFYLGLKERRVRGREFSDFVEAFMAAAQKEYGPGLVMQFEEFEGKTNYHILVNCKERYATFNDLVQGSACAVLAGILSSLKAKDAPKRLVDHTILCFGSSEIALTLGNLLAVTIAKEDGSNIKEARKRVWFFDEEGLITEARAASDKEMDEFKKDWAHDATGLDSSSLLAAIKSIKPSILVGASGVHGAFDADVIQTMSLINKRPVIITTSHKKADCECSAEDAFKHTGASVLFASAAHYEPLKAAGKTFHPSRVQNIFVFPGLALGAISIHAHHIPDELFFAAANSVAEQVTQGDLARGELYPSVENINQISTNVAVAVAKEAFNLKGKVAKVKKTKKVEKLVSSYQYDFEEK